MRIKWCDYSYRTAIILPVPAKFTSSSVIVNDRAVISRQCSTQYISLPSISCRWYVRMDRLSLLWRWTTGTAGDVRFWCVTAATEVWEERHKQAKHGHYEEGSSEIDGTFKFIVRLEHHGEMYLRKKFVLRIYDSSTNGTMYLHKYRDLHHEHYVHGYPYLCAALVIDGRIRGIDFFK